MRRHHHPREPVIDNGLDLLDLLICGGSSEQLREFFRLTYGCQWLSGMTAVVAATLAPLGPDTRYRPADLPNDGDQRENAGYWLRLTEVVTERRGYAKYFQDTYFAARSDPAVAEPVPLPEPPAPAADANVDTGKLIAEVPSQQTDTVRPVWDKKLRVLTVGEWTRPPAARQAKVVIAVLGCDPGGVADGCALGAVAAGLEG